jgi:peptide/nickel transport system ATP-binding protein
MQHDIVLDVQNLVKHYVMRSGMLFGKRGKAIRAVDGVSFKIRRGRTLSLVGESGCGKSTVGRAVLRLVPPTAGAALFCGRNIFKMGSKELQAIRPRLQMIFQDPHSALDPRMTVGEIIGESVAKHRIVPPEQLEEYTLSAMADCGLSPDGIDAFPHEFSGGQRQRICIARALALRPELIICDEPVSALDVSIQAQIINLMMDMQRERGLTYLFISHDLSVVEHISDEVGVMYLGRIVELADKHTLYRAPLHPYTRALLAAVPVPDPDAGPAQRVLSGDVPFSADVPPGCRFHTRCPECMEICRRTEPTLLPAGEGHFVACHLAAQDFSAGWA